MARRRTANSLGRDFSRIRQPDKITKDSRSRLMSRIRSTGTKFELDFNLQLKKFTRKRFETNVTSIRGRPDIVFDKYRVCVFLDSDFWHGWQYPRWKHLLKDDFWRNKIEKNRERDKRTTRHLRRNGWNVIRIWEHRIKVDVEGEIARVLRLL
jgi:DNA mismatch endonuclease, patch repair protein